MRGRVAGSRSVPKGREARAGAEAGEGDTGQDSDEGRAGGLMGE